MAAPAPAIFLCLVVSASGLLRASAVRAEEEAAPGEDEAAAAVAFPDERFGPRYVIDEVQVRGNRKTEKSIITAEAAALGLVQGAAVDASDRVWRRCATACSRSSTSSTCGCRSRAAPAAAA
jgi:hypothetical protein